MRQTRIL